MTDLVEWLEAAIGERERIARAALPGPWAVDKDDQVYVPHLDRLTIGQRFDGSQFTSVDRTYVLFGDGGGGCGCGCSSRDEAEHIALNDPASVLRRCQADRKILAEHPIYTLDPYGMARDEVPFGCGTCHDCGEGFYGGGFCDTLKALAEGYGYQEET